MSATVVFSYPRSANSRRAASLRARRVWRFLRSRSPGASPLTAPLSSPSRRVWREGTRRPGFPVGRTVVPTADPGPLRGHADVGLEGAVEAHLAAGAGDLDRDRG